MAKDISSKQISEISDDLEEYEDEVVEMISELDTGDGARWDDLIDMVEKKRLSRDIIEEVISNLLDKGLLYEPVLGFLKAV
jgi:DNA replicative helicase MCM subunit Mcm2 (Cdc46/Mcm family)